MANLNIRKATVVTSESNADKFVASLGGDREVNVDACVVVVYEDGATAKHIAEMVRAAVSNSKLRAPA